MTSFQEQRNGDLRREVGILGAIMMGLGSILGTGIFVSVAIAAGAAGPSVVLAVLVAALVATCNGLSSAQLAANHPVSGGTYEYGYRWLHPMLGFTAGWMFLCAKSASAATAALGLAGYSLHAARLAMPSWIVPLGLASVAILVLLVLAGIRRSSDVNLLIVGIAVAALLLFVLAGLPQTLAKGTENFIPFFAPSGRAVAPLAGFFEACALMFVAYTGYGRIATLGEEIRQPRTSIPRAIAATLVVSMLLYLSVVAVAIAVVGADTFAASGRGQAAPLEIVAERFAMPGLPRIMAIGAVAAMMGVLLNLILGLSRVVLAMGRRRDLPAAVAQLDRSGATPYVALVLVGVLIAGLVMIGNVKTTWSFSAFTVLVYYAITNACALRLNSEERFIPRVIPLVGLAACLFLAFWVETTVWLVGLGLIGVGLAWHAAQRRWS